MSERHCIFCYIIERAESAFIVYENSHAVVFLDKHPINEGHVLVAPKHHVASFHELDETPFTELMLVVRRMASVLEATYQPQKVGMLAAGFALFCLRYLIPEERWSERAAKISVWSLNIGLALQIFATLFPLGLLQLYESVNTGYFEARSLEYITNPTNALIEWMRLPGDVLFIVGGVLPLLYVCYLGVRYTVPRITMEELEDILFTEVTEPEATGPRER